MLGETTFCRVLSLGSTFEHSSRVGEACAYRDRIFVSCDLVPLYTVRPTYKPLCPAEFEDYIRTLRFFTAEERHRKYVDT